MSSKTPKASSGNNTSRKVLPVLKQMWGSFRRSSLGDSSSRPPAVKVKNVPKEILPPSHQFSTERKLDILGVALVVIGLITLLSLFANQNNITATTWLSVLRGLFGMGAYLLPLTLIALGTWLVLRHSEKLPQLAFERLVGLGLLFLNLLTWLHYFYTLLSLSLGNTRMIEDIGTALDFGIVSEAGGYIGGTLAFLLLIMLGTLGSGVILTAWLVIALTLSLDVPVPTLFQWMAPLSQKINLFWQELLQKRFFSRRRTTFNNIPMRSTPPASGVPQSHPQETLGTPANITGMPMIANEITQQGWLLPGIDQILERQVETPPTEESETKRAKIIEDTLTAFGAPAHVIEIHRGPTITQFGVEPDFIETRRGRLRVRVSKIAALVDDLALALAAKRIRIQAPVPGKGFVGIEVPNEQTTLVSLRNVVESTSFHRQKTSLRFALGQNVAGEPVAADLNSMPHLLIAGATGSGKSVCVNGIITCLLLHNTPQHLRFIMVDPKRVELSGYNGIPHLLAPVVVELKQVVGALQWVTREMDRRYHAFADAGVRNLSEYNRWVETQALNPTVNPTRQSNRQPALSVLPYLVVIIDELADLMMLAPDETERSVTRLAQLARATGIHLILATQRPSVDVVTGVIKANLPARIAFAVASSIDSRVILDQPGAERLLGSGDMLFQSPDAPAPVRLQGIYVSEGEMQRIVTYWREHAAIMAGSIPASNAIPSGPPPDAPPVGIALKQLNFLEEEKTAQEDADPLLSEAIDLVRRQGRASISMLQRRYRIGYTRAARLIDIMEDRNIIGAPDAVSGTREVLDYGPAAPPADND